MRAGELRHRITLQAATVAGDSMGGRTETWTDMDTVWAAIWPFKAELVLEARKYEMDVTHRIRIRYRSDVKPSWRVLFGARVFSILSIINPDERNRQLDLMCEENI